MNQNMRQAGADKSFPIETLSLMYNKMPVGHPRKREILDIILQFRWSQQIRFSDLVLFQQQAITESVSYLVES